MQSKPGPARTRDLGLSFVSSFWRTLKALVFGYGKPAAPRANVQARHDATDVKHGVTRLLRAGSPSEFAQAVDRLQAIRDRVGEQRYEAQADVLSRQIRWQVASLSPAAHYTMHRNIHLLSRTQSEAFASLVPGLKGKLMEKFDQVLEKLDQDVCVALRGHMEQILKRAADLGRTGLGGRRTLGVDALDDMIAVARKTVQDHGYLLPENADQKTFALGLITMMIASSASANAAATERFLHCLPDRVLQNLRGLPGPVGFNQTQIDRARDLVQTVKAERLMGTRWYLRDHSEGISRQNQAAFTTIVGDGLAGGLSELLSSMERYSDRYLQNDDPTFPGGVYLHGWSGQTLRKEAAEAAISGCTNEQVQALRSLLTSADAIKLRDVMAGAARHAHQHLLGPYWHETTLSNRAADLDLLREAAMSVASSRSLPEPAASQPAGPEAAIVAMVRRGLGIPLLSSGDAPEWTVDLRSRADALNATPYDVRTTALRNALHAGVGHGLLGLLSTLQLESHRLLPAQGPAPTSVRSHALDEPGHEPYGHATQHAFAALTDAEVLGLHSLLDSDVAQVMRDMMTEAAGTATASLAPGIEEQILRARSTDLTILRDAAVREIRQRGLEVPEPLGDLYAMDEAREIILHSLGISVGQRGHLWRVDARPVSPQLREAMETEMNAFAAEIASRSKEAGNSHRLAIEQQGGSADVLLARSFSTDISRTSLRYLKHDTQEWVHWPSGGDSEESAISQKAGALLRDVAGGDPERLHQLSFWLGQDFSKRFYELVIQNPSLSPIQTNDGPMVCSSGISASLTIIPDAGGGITLRADASVDSIRALLDVNSGSPIDDVDPLRSYQRVSYGVYINSEGHVVPLPHVLEGHDVVSNADHAGRLN